ncbi:MAG: hypothetical protein KME05_22030 [Gloeocapsa sp. UFS-A4-WI-NPMV-4B04]|nr:hypothetical protein [Gloeocapsa sp. UFS-A4-WI-NPMV-4B04]
MNEVLEAAISRLSALRSRSTFQVVRNHGSRTVKEQRRLTRFLAGARHPA